MTGTPDPLLGVSTTDDAGCAVPGALVARFSSPSGIASYSFVATQQQIVRTICDDAGAPTSSVLANHVIATTSPRSPVAWCDDDESAPCSTSSRTVNIRLTESNNPPNASVPYSYTLTASLRTDAGRRPVPGTAGAADSVRRRGVPGRQRDRTVRVDLERARLRPGVHRLGGQRLDVPGHAARLPVGLHGDRYVDPEPGHLRFVGTARRTVPDRSRSTRHADPRPVRRPHAADVRRDARSGCPGGHASPGVYTTTRS